MKRMMVATLAAFVLPSLALAQVAPVAVADPARHAAADRAVAALVPDGIYERMMRDQFPAMMDAMTAQMMGMSPSEFAGGAADGTTMAEAMREVDPAFEERTKISTRIMSQELGVVMGRMEPRVRAGLGRAFARKFTARQLDDMNAFFATPSGKAFAEEYLLLFVDPEVMTEMSAAMPEMMKAMPAMMQKVEAATAHLPPAKLPSEDAE